MSPTCELDFLCSFAGTWPTATTQDRVNLCRGLCHGHELRYGLGKCAHRAVQFTEVKLAVCERDGQRFQRLEVYAPRRPLEHVGVRPLHTNPKLGVVVTS